MEDVYNGLLPDLKDIPSSPSTQIGTIRTQAAGNAHIVAIQPPLLSGEERHLKYLHPEPTKRITAIEADLLVFERSFDGSSDDRIVSLAEGLARNLGNRALEIPLATTDNHEPIENVTL